MIVCLLLKRKIAAGYIIGIFIPKIMTSLVTIVHGINVPSQITLDVFCTSDGDALCMAAERTSELEPAVLATS